MCVSKSKFMSTKDFYILSFVRKSNGLNSLRDFNQIPDRMSGRLVLVYSFNF